MGLHVIPKVQLHACSNPQLVVNNGVQLGSVSCRQLALECLISLQVTTGGSVIASMLVASFVLYDET